MLNNFQLLAIIIEGNQTILKSIPLHETSQDDLTESWNTQYNAFISEKEEIDFIIGYTLEDDECFRLCSYKPGNWITDRNSENVRNVDELYLDQISPDRIKGIAAFARDEQNDELKLFQNFTRSQVIQPDRFIFRERDSYKGREDPGLRLDNKLSAVYFPQEEKLLFRSYRNVNTFLPVSDFYYEASEEDIMDILNDPLFECSDKNMLVNNSTQWMRKRFAMLKDSGVLNDYSVPRIETRARRYNVEIQVVNDKIIFPTDNAKAKRLLQLLNEEIFQGALTDDIYETNSKKKADL